MEVSLLPKECMETWNRTRACGDACDDAGDAAGGEGEATLPRTRLGADAGPADASDGEANADVDIVGVRGSDHSVSLRGGGLLQLRCFSSTDLALTHFRVLAPFTHCRILIRTTRARNAHMQKPLSTCTQTDLALTLFRVLHTYTHT